MKIPDSRVLVCAGPNLVILRVWAICNPFNQGKSAWNFKSIWKPYAVPIWDFMEKIFLLVIFGTLFTEIPLFFDVFVNIQFQSNSDDGWGTKNIQNSFQDGILAQSGRGTWNAKKTSKDFKGATRMALMKALKWAPTWYASADTWYPFYGQPLDQVWMWYESLSVSWDISSGGSF